MVEQIKQLCIENKTSIKALERELNFGNGTIRRWDDIKPSYDRISKVAEYFNVPVSRILNIPRIAHLDKIEELYGQEAVEAYLNEDYAKYERIIETKQKKPAPISESELDNNLIKTLTILTPEEILQVDAFVQGLIAARKA